MSLHYCLAQSVQSRQSTCPLIAEKENSQTRRCEKYLLYSNHSESQSIFKCSPILRSVLARRKFVSEASRSFGSVENIVNWNVNGLYMHRPTTICSAGRLRAAPVAVEADTSRKQEYSIDEAIEAVGFGQYQKLLLLYAGMAWTAEAMEMMLLSFVGPSLKDVWGLSPGEESLITSVVFLGMMVGAYSWGVLSDAKGRRVAGVQACTPATLVCWSSSLRLSGIDSRVGFFATAVLTFIAGLLSSSSPNYLTLLVLRGMVGLGLGGGPVVSSWFMEFVPSANRGLWMVVVSLFWTLGSILEASLAWAVMPHLGWRWLLALSSLPLAVLLAFYPLIPESPRYLASKGNTKMATDVLKRMAVVNGRPLPSGALVSSIPSSERSQEHALDEINNDFEEEEKKSGSESDIIHLLAECPREGTSIEVTPRNGVDTKAVSMSTDLEFFSKFTILLSPPVIRSTLLLWSVFLANSFTYYGLVLLSSQLSVGAGDGLYRNVFITSTAEIPGLVVAAAVADKFGRKRSMAGLFGLCGLFLLPLMQPQGELITTSLLFGARASIMGAFTVLYIYAPEVYPTSLRSTGLGTANSFGRIGGLLCPLVAVNLVASSQRPLAVAVFTFVAFSASIMVLNFPFETNGQALPDSLGGSDDRR